MADDLHQIHDAFFKQFYGQPAAAAEFLQHNLPPTVARAIDFGTLTPSEANFVSKRGRRYFADLVYDCRLKDGNLASIYILFEHKSAPAPMCALQILRYMLMIWEKSAKPITSAHVLPVVIPVVIYHGERPWNGVPMRALFPKDAALDAYIPAFAMEFFDLARLPESEIKGGIAGKAALLLWKALQEKSPTKRIVQLAQVLLSALGPDSAMETIAQFLYYAQSVNESVSWDEVEKELAALPEGEAIMKSFVIDVAPEAYQKGILEGMEKGMERGMEKGMEKGRQEGGRDYALRLLLRFLERRFDVLPARLSAKIKSINDVDVLEALHAKVLDTESLESFEAYLDKVLEDEP